MKSEEPGMRWCLAQEIAVLYTYRVRWLRQWARPRLTQRHNGHPSSITFCFLSFGFSFRTSLREYC